jgi:hypothetical protein
MEMNVRQPLQVIVFPFRVTAAEPEYTIFRRPTTAAGKAWRAAWRRART